MSTSSRSTIAHSRPDNRTQDRVTPKGPKRARTEAEESDEGPSGRNRLRVSRACNECRRRKDRCDGQRPSCKSCIENGRLCSYEPSKKRGLRTGYVRAVEILLGLIFTTIEGSETWICSLLEGTAKQTTFQAISRGKIPDISAEFLLEAWRKGSVAKEVGQLLAPEGIEDDLDGTDSMKYFDTKVSEALALSLASRDSHLGAPPTPMNTETTPQDVAPFDLSTTPITSHSSPSVIGNKEISSRTSTDNPSGPVPLNNLGDLPSPAPQLPSHWPYLLDLYFETTHSWLPISQKHDLLRAAYTLANGNTSTVTISSGESAFVHAVIAYASHQSTSLLNSFKPPINNTYKPQSHQSLTQTILFADPTTYDLGHVRAFLVLSLFEMSQKSWPAAWTLIGRAVYTAMSIGLLPRNSGTVNGPCDDGVRRTLLGCATVETVIAARLNTMPHLQSADISLKGPLKIDGIEEWEPWQPKILLGKDSLPNQQNVKPPIPGRIISTFNRLLKVMAILNDLIHHRRNLYSEKNLYEIICACQHNLSSLNDLVTTADMSPQTLCLWVASAATFKIAASAYSTSCGTFQERPDGYWTSFAWLASLPEKQCQSIGRCSISPLVEACLVLLQESLGHQQIQYPRSGVESNFNVLGQTISRSLAALENQSDKDLQLDHVSNSSLRLAGEVDSQLLHSISPELTNNSILPLAAMSIEIPPPISNLNSILDGMNSSLSQDQSSTDNTTQVAGSRPLNFGSTMASSGEDLPDDGLFDSLATLDSVDW